MSTHHLNAKTEVQIADDQVLAVFVNAICIWVDWIAEGLV